MKFNLPSMVQRTIFLTPLFLSACGGVGGSDEDTSPDFFYFEDEDDVALGESVISEGIEVEGINTETEISIEGGEYSINGAEFTDEDGEVSEGDIIYVRVEASDEIDTEVEATVTIGGVDDTFTVTTEDVSLVIQDAFKALSFDWVAAEGADYYQLFYKADADSEFEQVGRDIEAGSSGFEMEIPIHLTDWYNAEYYLQTCTEAECSATDEVPIYDYMLRSIGYIKAPNPESFDKFGVVELSADGNTLVVGAPGEDGGSSGLNGDEGNNAISGSGAVYIFVKEDDVWNYQSYLKAPNTGASDAFGSSLALSSDGNTLAVGAPLEDSNASGVDGDMDNDDLSDAGAVFIYKRIGSLWALQNYLKASNPGQDDAFGTNLSLSAYGSTLVVGVPNEDSDTLDPDVNNSSQSGAAYVFTQQGDNWQQTSYLKAPIADANDQFGYAVSINANGDTLLISSPFEDSSAQGLNGDQLLNDSENSGAVYSYTFDGTSWTLSNYLKASNTSPGQQFGNALELSADGSTILVGAPYEASLAIGINGDENDLSNPDSGAAYLFKQNSSSWQQEAYIKSSNGDISDLFGSSLSLNWDGSVLAIAAPGESSAAEGVSGTELDNTEVDSGAVYVYEDLGSGYEQVKYVKAPNTDSGDAFGEYLSLDGDGETLAIGAPNEQSSSALFENIQSSNSEIEAGAAYLY